MAKTGNDKQDVTITLSDDGLQDMDALAGRMRKAGFEIDQILGSVGIVSGRGKPSALAAIRKLKGVAAVEAAGEVTIPAPD